MNTLQIGDCKLTWMKGGMTQLDGGAMFGVVPKALWSKRYPSNELNQIPLRSDPILVQVHGKNILIESGMGTNRLNDKQKRNFGLIEESELSESLQAVGLLFEDIDMVLMTHMHYDHANGLVSVAEDGSLYSTFPNATIYINEIEWNELRSPNIRSRNTYWEDNWRPIEKQVCIYADQKEIVPEIKMVHTGGHSDGHAIILFESKGEKACHMADIMPTHAHQNPLWVMAYDDYPMTSIYAKEKWLKEMIAQQAWFTFYHDAKYRAVKWNEQGQMLQSIPINHH
ncbi:YtnP family quorum-quenching lactonase [Brevibacillus sp. VP]|uniref:YtnP family quorum-quenching lactonase n=1 Tax=unclassified Brevibacillus TaxID=2684853 RepID=UPI000E2E519D|nr:MBL fold metallo-hydrolase [Brevibacillus sp. VP]RFB34079.1 MBL fold metallo-hydrolase [Brevibacillus sp. VP]